MYIYVCVCVCVCVCGGCISFEKERIEHANIMCQLRKENTCNVVKNVNEWMDGYVKRVCILFSKAEYVNHRKSLERRCMHIGFSP